MHIWQLNVLGKLNYYHYFIIKYHNNIRVICRLHLEQQPRGETEFVLKEVKESLAKGNNKLHFSYILLLD